MPNMKDGHVTITRTEGGDAQYIKIEIGNADGRVRATLSLEDFARCLTGRAHTPADVERREPVGG